MAKTGLEERLEAVAREFVQRIVAEIRSASFAEVAGYAPQRVEHAETAATARAQKATRVVAASKRSAGAASSGGGGGAGGERQTAEKRAELSERVVETLRNAGEPLSARALAATIGVPPDLLVAPLLELRAAARIAKHGEKRATTYSLP